MGCNCGGSKGTGQRYQLLRADGTSGGTYVSRTEAIAAMSAEPGSKVITTT
jgi:hypothetical protein